MRERANQLRTSLAAIAGFEVVMEGQDMRAVTLTLATGQSVPWHYHTDITDSFIRWSWRPEHLARHMC
jgi:quercetin dioxygenase-like cupin family protein